MTGHFPQRQGALSLLLTFVLLAASGCGDASSGPNASATAAVPAPAVLALPKIEFNGVAALTTQWYPDNSHCNVPTENRLLREVVRQGVLMALREELQLVTRDETLGEPLANSDPDGEPGKVAAPEPLSLSFHWEQAGPWHAELSGAGAPANNAVWKHDGTFKFSNRTFYAQFAAQMAELSKPIAEQLRAAGATGTPRELNPDNVPPAEVETQLTEMNFVSQYAAVRAAHQAMAAKGPSLPWLGVLVRGYANLAMLTQHTWTSQHEAFAARSIVYAERLMQLSDRSRWAQLHQAYAYALIGVHGHALDLLAADAGKSEQPAAVAKADGDAEPAWAALIEPFSKFQPSPLEQLGADHAELEELAALLRWHVYRSYVHGRWINDVGIEAMQACPEAYSIYAVMANWSSLGVMRMGASAATSVFGKRLPERVAKLPDLPKSARAFAAPPTPLLSKLLGIQSDDNLSERPIKIARTLQTATQKETTPTECSWAILGTLIAEEQFVQAANVIKVSGAAVEHSHRSLVERLAPLVKGHRYAAYIDSYAPSRREPHLAAEAMRAVKIVDPRMVMRPMFSKVWHSPTADGSNGNEHAYRAIWSRNRTHPNLHDNWYGLEGGWSNGVPAEHRRYFGKEFREISPHSPQAIRLQWETAEKYDVPQIQKWEQQLGDDPVGWLSIADRYYKLNKLEDATRCYQRSLDISPSYDGTYGLANCYYYNGRKDLWKPTLETYLKVEDLGLAHAQIHQQIAGECVMRRSWSEAEPHALEAAQTYSASGLELASVIYEGQQEWKKSERFIAEASKNYASYSSGGRWYFWCQRTGRGDLDEARAIAEPSIALAATRTFLDDAHRTFTYRLLEGDATGALTGMEQQVKLCGTEDLWNRIWRLLHTVAVAEETDNATWKKQALDELRALTQQEVKADSPDWVLVLDSLIRAFESEELSMETFAKYDEVIESGSASGRCNYEYFMGVALDQQGKSDAADEYWRRAAFGGPYAHYNCTLAGHRLAKKHGEDRGGLPDRYAKQEAEAAAAWEESQAEAASDDAEEQRDEEGGAESETDVTI